MGKFAIIDIGSNTVRLVVYENRARAPYLVFNEKVFCRLGRGVAAKGHMIDKSMNKAAKTLRRFALLLKKMSIDDYRVIATSAVRDANNSAEFIQRIKNETGIDIEVIDGIEEARLSANGVICAVPHATGIIGDMGGGSLELAMVHDRQVDHEISLPIGPLQFQDDTGVKLDAPKEKIDQHLDSVDWLKKARGRKFYAVGGAWRTLARIHMNEKKYPLINMHNYIIPVDEITDLAYKISKMKNIELEQYRPHISSKRIKMISLAALALYRLLKMIKPCKFVVSAFGVREGILYDGMDKEVREQDPLIVGCHQVAEMTGRFPDHGERLNDWIEDLFEDESAEHKRLRLAICILCDVGWRGHPEYRADKVVSEILYGRLSGINHWGAALIAMALYICYGGSEFNVPQVKTAKSLISNKDLQYARKIGLALRLAQRISGGTSDGLKTAELKTTNKLLSLKVETEMLDLVNEVVEKRVKKLAKFLDVEYEISEV
ncbi:MAG: Ppx/GppA family phosphatase [Kordiimonadaceae bacterium]|nr:Ppx/GppA family phosphatase [Kordiimonadaceae bacterium]